MPHAWIHETRTYRETDDSGALVLERPYTAEENASADVIDAARAGEVNAQTLRDAMITAHDSNKAWRLNVAPQIISGADQVIGASSSSAQEKQLANGMKSLTNRLDYICAQNNALIRLLLNRFDGVD